MVLAQLRGFVDNLWTSIGAASWEGYLPPSIVSSIIFFANAIPDAFGFGSRQDMLRGSVVLAGVAILSSVVTLGATLALVAVFAGTFAVGIVRHVPIVEAYWPLPEWEVFG